MKRTNGYLVASFPCNCLEGVANRAETQTWTIELEIEGVRSRPLRNLGPVRGEMVRPQIDDRGVLAKMGDDALAGGVMIIPTTLDDLAGIQTMLRSSRK